MQLEFFKAINSNAPTLRLSLNVIYTALLIQKVIQMHYVACNKKLQPFN
jgi:hypothetical protein